MHPSWRPAAFPEVAIAAARASAHMEMGVGGKERTGWWCSGLYSNLPVACTAYVSSPVDLASAQEGVLEVDSAFISPEDGEVCPFKKRHLELWWRYRLRRLGDGGLC